MALIDPGYFQSRFWPAGFWVWDNQYWPAAAPATQNPPSVDVMSILNDDFSIDLTFRDNLFVGREPSSPDNCVTIFDTPGFGPVSAYSMDVQYDYPSVQIRVRNKDYRIGWRMILAIKQLLHNKAHFTVNGTRYESVECALEPALLDWDENNRVRFVSTFNLQVSGWEE